MLSHAHGLGYKCLDDVPAYLREAAASREAEWQINVPERLGFWRDPLGVIAPTYTKVRFTEKEFSRFGHLIMQPMRNGTKVTTMYANLEQAAATCFPSGSVEHVAMRHLGCTALIRYYTQADVNSYNYLLLAKVVGGVGLFLSGFDRKLRGWPYGCVLGRPTLCSMLVGAAATCVWVLSHSMFRRIDAPFLTRTDVDEVHILEDEVAGSETDEDDEQLLGDLDCEPSEPDDDDPDDCEVVWLSKYRRAQCALWRSSITGFTIKATTPSTTTGPTRTTTPSAAKAAPAVVERVLDGKSKKSAAKAAPLVNATKAVETVPKSHARDKPVLPGKQGLGSPVGLPTSFGPPGLQRVPFVKCAPSDNGGNTPDDATVMASSSVDGRTYTTDVGIVAVIGQEFDKTVPHNQQPVVGALLGPCSKPPNVYTKNLRNLRACIEERITKKQLGNTLGAADLMKIGRIISKACSHDLKLGVFSETRIRRWCEENFADVEGMRSGKWSIDRMRQAVYNLYCKTFLPDEEMPPTIDERGVEHPVMPDESTFKFEAKVKAEDMPEGKSPRMLIAEGDEGQLMALVVIKCFEDLLFEWFEDKSIKHKSKKDAVKNIIKQLTKKGGCAIEGDGSAWDTTCGHKIREAIENPILRRIMEVVIGYGVVPEAWHREHTKSCEAKELRLFYDDKFDKIRFYISSIRRSGHRGTSVLNWWVNFVMWISSIFASPEGFLDPAKRMGKDVTGVMRWWNGVFEGDDSLCVLEPPMRDGGPLSVKFLDWWDRAGFNMKIVFCRTRATVVGWHIACTNGQLTRHASPELPRALASSGVGVSTSTVSAARSGDFITIRKVAAAAAMARAGEFAGILPTVSEKYLRYSLSLCNTNLVDREMSIRVFGSDGHDSRDVVAEINALNGKVTPAEELYTMRWLNYYATPEQMDLFKTYHWSLEPEVLTDYVGFEQSLPPKWRLDA